MTLSIDQDHTGSVTTNPLAVSASGSRRVRLLTDEQRDARRIYARQRRAQQSDEQKRVNRDRFRERARHRRAAMTDEQKEAERRRGRDRARDRRESRSPHYQCALLRADGSSNPVDTTTLADSQSVVRMRDVEHCASLARRSSRCAVTVVRRCYLLSLLCRHSCMGCTSVVMLCLLISWLPYPLLIPIYWTIYPSAATFASTYGRTTAPWAWLH